VKKIQGYWWPDDVGEKWKHSLRHVRSIEWAIARCQRKRTALQAGGNIGLWPRRLADVFARVITFEPDATSCACLLLNTADVASRVEVQSKALGAAPGRCNVQHRSLGSHQVVEGAEVEVTTIDALGLTDLDFLQLDIEGYEWHALQGALVTIARCRPLIQLELRGFTEKYGASDEAVRAVLASLGYREVSQQRGNDVVFEAAPRG
jgi:FkbM family methyltransferase